MSSLIEVRATVQGDAVDDWLRAAGVRGGRVPRLGPLGIVNAPAPVVSGAYGISRTVELLLLPEDDGRVERAAREGDVGTLLELLIAAMREHAPQLLTGCRVRVDVDRLPWREDSEHG